MPPPPRGSREEKEPRPRPSRRHAARRARACGCPKSGGPGRSFAPYRRAAPSSSGGGRIEGRPGPSCGPEIFWGDWSATRGRLQLADYQRLTTPGRLLLVARYWPSTADNLLLTTNPFGRRLLTAYCWPPATGGTFGRLQWPPPTGRLFAAHAKSRRRKAVMQSHRDVLSLHRGGPLPAGVHWGRGRELTRSSIVARPKGPGSEESVR